MVAWKGYDQCECTWEPEWNLTNAQETVDRYRERVGL
ncbi:chromo domain-containing protein [Acinetobacter pittii]